MKRKRILWISPFVPHDNVDHAGGQTHNFYIKGLAQTGHYDIHLISLARLDEIPQIDLKESGITYEIVGIYPDKNLSPYYNLESKIIKIERWNLLSKYAGFVNPIISKGVLGAVTRLKNTGYKPDIVVLEWTQVVLLIDEIKKIFPKSIYYAIEVDVSYLSYFRKYNHESNIVKKLIKRKQYDNLKNKELLSIQRSNTVIVNNYKDKKLLEDENLQSDIFSLTPYYHSYIDKPYSGGTRNILMYGAMSRIENYSSVIWFIENVWKKIKTTQGIKLYVVGSNPHESLNKYKSDNIIITGFVNDVSEFMIHSMCMVAPLIYGAGIKVKILESLSAGVPVLTNDVGIEGIEAVHNKHYFHCESVSDYFRIINDIVEGKIDVQEISRNTKELMSTKYSLKNEINKFDEKLMEDISKRRA